MVGCSHYPPVSVGHKLQNTRTVINMRLSGCKWHTSLYTLDTVRDGPWSV